MRDWSLTARAHTPPEGGLGAPANEMVYRDRAAAGGDSFFQPLPPQRLFTTTTVMVPQDRRHTSARSWAELRKPRPAKGGDPSVATVQPEKQGQHEARLHHAFHRFVERGHGHGGSARDSPLASGATPISFSMCTTPRSGPTPTPTPGPTPRGPAPRPIADPFPALDPNPGAQFVHYDAVQQAWRPHAAGKSPVLAWPCPLLGACRMACCPRVSRCRVWRLALLRPKQLRQAVCLLSREMRRLPELTCETSRVSGRRVGRLPAMHGRARTDNAAGLLASPHESGLSRRSGPPAATIACPCEQQG